MKVGAISGDMAVKLAIGAAVLGLGAFAFFKLKGALPEAVSAINPADPQNVINRGVSAVGDALVSPDGPGRNADGSWTLGGWAYDLLNPGTAQAIKNIGIPVSDAYQADTWDRILNRHAIVQTPDVYPDF